MAWIENLTDYYRQGKLIPGRRRNLKSFTDDVYPFRHRAEITLHDQHYLNGSQWEDTDESLAADTTDGYAVSATKLRHIIRIGSTGTRRWYPRRDHLDEYVTFGRLQSYSGTAWVNVNLGTPTRTGNQIVWDTTNFKLSLVNNWHRIKIEVVLKTEAARRRLRWAVTLKGLTYNNGDLTAISDGQIVGHVDLPIAWDANGSIDNQNVHITTTYSGGYIEFGGDLSGAVLPITIDPTFTDGYGGDVTTYKDSRIISGNPTGNYETDTLLRAGWWDDGDDNYRFLIQFDVSSIPASATINSAIMTFYAGFDFEGGTFTEEFYRVRRAWVEGEVTWNIAATGTNWATGGCNNTTSDREAATIATYSVTTPRSGAIDIALDTALVTEWVDGTFTNNGILSKGSIETGATLYLVDWDSSDHATPSHRPKLVVDYTAGGGAETVIPVLMAGYRMRRN